MASVTRTTIFADNNILDASQLNSEFNNLLNALNIVNSDISASAAIAASKISGTAATLAGPNTFTGPNILTINNYSPSGGGTATLNLANGNMHNVQFPAGNITLALSNPTTGQPFIVRLIQDGVGSRTVAWFSGITWTNGNTVPTLSTGSGAIDTFAFICTGSGAYDGYVVGQNI